MLTIRIKVLVIFALTCLLSLYLGFADISLPYDKWFHFTMFFFMTLGFYWIIDTSFLWSLRAATFITCTIIGAIGSEYLQHYLSPFRQFDYQDIMANICGSVSSIIVSEIYKKFYNDRNNYTDIALENIV